MVTGRKLLLADDSVTIQKVVDLTFSDEGLEVVTVGDGQQALEKLEEFTPDIVLADVFMPELNGYQLCEHVKRDERLSHIPVMLLVGSFEPFDEAEARRVGADDYLTKPFQSIHTLIGKVRNLLTGGGSAEASEQPTRQLASPPEAEKGNRFDTDSLERMTADTAPLPDVQLEATMPAARARAVPFTDLSMDDEMIEATPVSRYESGGPEAQHRATAQYSAADLREAGIMESVETEADRETAGAFAPASQEADSAEPQASAPVTSLAATDEMLLDLGESEPLSATAENDDFLLDLLDEGPMQPSAPAWTAASTALAEDAHDSVAEDAWAIASVEEATTETPAQEFEEGEPRQEPAPLSASSSAPTERLPEGFQVEGAFAAAPSAAQQTGQITLDQLSPEVIDAIARRAVEHLSERLVEQIAWEVVPQLAELIIKRRLEEEKK